jgi:ferredoxin
MVARASIGNGKYFLELDNLQDLIDVLADNGYTVIAPVVRNGVVRLAPVQQTAEIARGVRDEQSAGKYSLVSDDAGLMFQYAAAMDSAKRFLFPPMQRLYQVHVEGNRFLLDEGPPTPPRLAFFGLRPCDLAALQVLDRVFGVNDPQKMRCEGEYYFDQTRRDALLIVVNCNRPAGTCFCASMDTGPEAGEGYDLSLTELRNGFVVAVGSPTGQEIIAKLALRPPTESELELAELKMARAREQMGRHLDTRGLKEHLDRSIEHPHWNDVAKRCLSCGGCTMVCPSCFCSTVTDVTHLAEIPASRERLWASCFTHQFSYTTAGPVRNSAAGRYRHWLRHKFCTFFDQFGTSGCVGCGRCITWCPSGIDITEEAKRIQESQPSLIKEKNP